MFNEAVTLGQLRDRIDFWIKTMGADAPVGLQSGKLLDAVMMDWVFINKRTDKIVGTEAEDEVYGRRLKRGHRDAVRIS